MILNNLKQEQTCGKNWITIPERPNATEAVVGRDEGLSIETLVYGLLLSWSHWQAFNILGENLAPNCVNLFVLQLLLANYGGIDARPHEQNRDIFCAGQHVQKMWRP